MSFVTKIGVASDYKEPGLAVAGRIFVVIFTG